MVADISRLYVIGVSCFCPFKLQCHQCFILRAKSSCKNIMTYVQQAETSCKVDNWAWAKSISLFMFVLNTIETLTEAKNWRLRSKNPFALIAMSNFVICSINSCFALCKPSLSPLQNTNSSTFLASCNCWMNENTLVEQMVVKWYAYDLFYLDLTIVTGIQ